MDTQMIQAAKRGRGGDRLGWYLINAGENEQVVVLPARGVVASETAAQLSEIVARAAHGRTEKPVLHLHVDPSTEWTEAQYDRHLELYEAEFGLARQPRLAVFHRKDGRGHRHYVWSVVRQDGRVIPLGNDYARREKISRILESEFGELHVRGRHNRAVAEALRREGRLDVLATMEVAGLLEGERPVAALSSAQRQQQRRTGVRPQAVVSAVVRAWQSTSNGPAFARALEAGGLALAMGDVGVVVVDPSGNAHGLARLLGKAAKKTGGSRVGAADVQRRIVGLELLTLHAVRVETQVAAIVDDLEQEVAPMIVWSASEPEHVLQEHMARKAEQTNLVPEEAPIAAGEDVHGGAAAEADLSSRQLNAEELHASETSVDEAADDFVQRYSP